MKSNEEKKEKKSKTKSRKNGQRKHNILTAFPALHYGVRV